MKKYLLPFFAIIIISGFSSCVVTAYHPYPPHPVYWHPLHFHYSPYRYREERMHYHGGGDRGNHGGNSYGPRHGNRGNGEHR